LYKITQLCQSHLQKPGFVFVFVFLFMPGSVILDAPQWFIKGTRGGGEKEAGSVKSEKR
jgi:hypothetical protein